MRSFGVRILVAVGRGFGLMGGGLGGMIGLGWGRTEFAVWTYGLAKVKREM